MKHTSEYGFIFADSRWLLGVDLHADGFCGFTDREKHLSRVMRGFWRNLASTGDPNLADADAVTSGNPGGARASDAATYPSGGAGEFRTTFADALLGVGSSMPAVPAWPRFMAEDAGGPAGSVGGAGFLFDITDPSGVGRALPTSSMTTKCALMSEVPMAYSRMKPPLTQ